MTSYSKCEWCGNTKDLIKDKNVICYECRRVKKRLLNG
jgi:hypothetical protein